MKIKGQVIKVGNNVDTDQIIPGRYLNNPDTSKLGEHCLEGYDPEFPVILKEKGNTILIAGENFGCGSSREHAPLALKKAGIRAVIANSFARIFFRNAINLGLPAITAPEAVKKIEENHEVEVFLQKGLIKNLTTGKSYKFVPFADFLHEIVKKGGIKEFLKDKG